MGVHFSPVGTGLTDKKGNAVDNGLTESYLCDPGRPIPSSDEILDTLRKQRQFLQKIFGCESGAETNDSMAQLWGRGMAMEQRFSKSVIQAQKESGLKEAELQNIDETHFLDSPLVVGSDENGNAVTFNPTVGQVIDMVGRWERQASKSSILEPDFEGERMRVGESADTDTQVRVSLKVYRFLTEQLHASKYGEYFEGLKRAFNDPENLAEMQRLYELEHGVPLSMEEGGNWWPTRRVRPSFGQEMFGATYSGAPSFVKDVHPSPIAYVNQGIGLLISRHKQTMRTWGGRIAAREMRKLWYHPAMQEALNEQFGRRSVGKMNKYFDDTFKVF